MPGRGKGRTVPDAYYWVSLARYLGTTPWELEHAPLKWIYWGTLHMEVDAALQEGLRPVDG